MSHRVKRYLTKTAKKLGVPTPDENQAEEAIQADLRRRKMETERKRDFEKTEAKVKEVIFAGDFGVLIQLDPFGDEEIIGMNDPIHKRFGKTVVTARKVLRNINFSDDSNIFDRKSPGDPPIREMDRKELLRRLTKYFADPRTIFEAQWIDKDGVHMLPFRIERVT